jgi:hypothetical protein
MADVTRYDINMFGGLYEKEGGSYTEYANYAALRESHRELLEIVRNTYVIGITDEYSYIEAAITRAEKL